MSIKFSIHDVPPEHTVFTYLAEQTRYQRAVAGVRPKARLDAQAKLELALVDVDMERLRASVLDIIRRRGYTGWRHARGESSVYGGFSLAYNPEHRDGLDPHVSSIGTPKNENKDFSCKPGASYEGGYGQMKNSYFDTYGFRQRTPAANDGYLGSFIDGFRLSMVRSRVGIIPGANISLDDKPYFEEGGWHRDATVFENLRINIPVQTDPNFVFESEGVAPYHLSVGKAYTWDTHQLHRVYCRGLTTTMRIHVILGFAPWFRYLPDEEAWETNEFFGELHPFDIVADGHLSRFLSLDSLAVAAA